MKWRRDWRRLQISNCRFLLSSLLLLCSVPGFLSSKIVTLGSIEIFRTHEWIPFKPIVYFRCQGENETTLPDVKEKNILYTFNGEESWQPLTELPDKKCKRCGLYEKDNFKGDDVFEEWELCPADFIEGKYVHIKDGEFNATFICLKCDAPVDTDQGHISKDDASGKRGKIALLTIICISASVLAAVGIFAAYKYWQKWKRENDQVRFLKLFEEGDDILDNLDLEEAI